MSDEASSVRRGGVGPERPRRLPRICYVGSLGVENKLAGSLQLFRLLGLCPSKDVNVVEVQPEASTAEARLPGVRYFHAPEKLPRGSRFARRRFATVFLGILRVHSWVAARRLAGVLREFGPEAIVTLHEGLGWLTAAALARRLRIPLHVILHDDWFRNWPKDRAGVGVEKVFRQIYCSAASRLCISPGMAEEYGERFGVAASVLYPIRSEAPPLEGLLPSSAASGERLMVGYAGNVFTAGYWNTLRELADALEPLDGMLLLHGSMTMADLERHGVNGRTVRLNGFVKEITSVLREQANVAFVPMTFESQMAMNMRISFPSKIADYTRAGLPLLVYGPSYCSAVRWAQEHRAAEIVSEEGIEYLSCALVRLLDPAHRGDLAERSVAASEKCFSRHAAREVFEGALLGKAETPGTVRSRA